MFLVVVAAVGGDDRQEEVVVADAETVALHAHTKATPESGVRQRASCDPVKCAQGWGWAAVLQDRAAGSALRPFLTSAFFRC